MSNYVFVVDYYSRWIEVSKLNKLTLQEVLKYTHSIFPRHRFPEVVVSDDDWQFSADLYAKFAHDYGFEHVLSGLLYR